MDEIVRRAMSKWPNVPDCYGWLELDARGNWRMRDEQAQRDNLPGDKIMHTALCGFINRNYASDDAGRWYFQNGPQRVFVNLEATPFIARTDAATGLELHTGESISLINTAWLTETGKLILQVDAGVAQVDDRDLEQCLRSVRTAETEVDDSFLLNWITDPGDQTPLWLSYREQTIAIGRLSESLISTRMGFVQRPSP
jgi:hypothetical protein